MSIVVFGVGNVEALNPQTFLECILKWESLNPFNVNRIWRNLPYLFQNWEEWTSQQYVHLSLRVFMVKALFPYFRWWGLEFKKKRSSFQNQLNEACLNDIHASSECSSRRCGCYISCVCDCMVQHYKGFGYMIIKTRLIDWIISINWVDLIDV